MGYWRFSEEELSCKHTAVYAILKPKARITTIIGDLVEISKNTRIEVIMWFCNVKYIESAIIFEELIASHISLKAVFALFLLIYLVVHLAFGYEHLFYAILCCDIVFERVLYFKLPWYILILTLRSGHDFARAWKLLIRDVGLTRFAYKYIAVWIAKASLLWLNLIFCNAREARHS